MKCFRFFWLLFILPQILFAAKVDTVLVPSLSMNSSLKAVVILPEKYKALDSVPVLYLLHGFGGNHRSWIDQVPELSELADRYQMLIVCPDGGQDSWYWDSPLVPEFCFETFVAKELPDWIDRSYRTIRSREGRAISGLSMGGQGALFIAFRHQQTFGAAGSTAGGVDIRQFPDNWGMARHLGSIEDFAERWDEYALIEMYSKVEPGALSLIIDCGADDFFYEVNEAFHKQLLLYQVPHTYIVAPGQHDWNYWRTSIRQQILHFYSFFYEKNPHKS